MGDEFIPFNSEISFGTPVL